MTAVEVFSDIVKGSGDVTFYRCEIQVRHLIVGGVPSDPSVTRGWLRTRLELDAAALDEMLAETIAERDAPMTVDEKLDAVVSKGAVNVNGFKRIPDTGELAYEGRCMKAAFKEGANSAYPGSEWPGKERVSSGFRKGLMNTLAERVRVVETYIGLGVKESSWIEERIKHPTDRTGRTVPAINRVEVVERPILVFTLRVHDDFLPRAAWARIWQRMEDIGIGADRGRSDGSFDLLAFDKID